MRFVGGKGDLIGRTVRGKSISRIAAHSGATRKALADGPLLEECPQKSEIRR
jgi:hypothetical protein